MGEIRCNLDWRGQWPKLVIEMAGALSEAQVRALAHGLSRKAQEMLNCLLACGGACPKEDDHGSGNPASVH